MKKFTIFALAALLVVAFTVPAAALETSWGGYWRTRMYTNQDFTGDTTEDMDFIWTDTRTRLYFTATLNDNLKYVFKSEFDSTWGGPDTLGDIGADGQKFEIKNSYADFNLGPVNMKVGIQGATLSRGFVFSDDFSGLVAAYKSDAVVVPFIWVKNWEGGQGKDANDGDFDYYCIAPIIAPSDMIKVQPYLVYATSDDISQANTKATANGIDLAALGVDDADIWIIGADLDVTLDAGSIWATALYEGGKLHSAIGGDDLDIGAWLLAFGGNFGAGPVDLHGQLVYSSGDDDDRDKKINYYVAPKGSSYYWAEIMGYGTFDAQVSNGSPGDLMSNIWFVQFGATFKPMEKMSLTGDIYYANLSEENAAGDDDLGTEIDLALSYELVEGLNMDVIFAYLFAGDATGDEDPWETGLQVSLSF
jgi:hypothetical protein